MAIPTYDKFYQTVLKVLKDGEKHDSKETIERCADAFHLTNEERETMLPSGRQTVLANRVGWARTYLKKAGLIISPSRGSYQITLVGRKALEESGQALTNEYLQKFPGFRNFTNAGNSAPTSSTHEIVAFEPVRTPLEIMDSAYQEIMEQLADDLMVNIMSRDWGFFERLVVDLLEKMGYGGTLEHVGEVTGRPGDEGIDGIIRQDTLGFDKIYVQAKKWKKDRPAGEPDIQQFAGALMGKGASKGLFITTSYFTKQAKRFVDKHMTARIVLVDGEALTRLMIRYNLGVSTISTFEIKRVDSDYFDEGNA